MPLSLKKRQYDEISKDSQKGASASNDAVNEAPDGGKKFQLKPHAAQEDARSIHDGPQVLTGDGLKQKRDEEAKAQKKAVKKDKTGSAWEWILMLVIAVPVGLFLWTEAGTEGSQRLHVYMDYRFYFFAAGWLLVVIEAFKLTRLSGCLSILFPPYWAYFLLTEADHKIIRGLATGLLLVIITELILIRESAFLTVAQENFNQFVNQAQGAISSESNYTIR